MTTRRYLPAPDEGVNTLPALRLTAAQRARAPEYRQRLEERLAEAMPSYFTARMREAVQQPDESPVLRHRKGELRMNGELR